MSPGSDSFRTETLPGTDAGVRRAAEWLRSGAVVALPSETVYGLAGDAFSEAAALAIFAAKGRPLTDPLIVHVSAAARSLADLAELGVIAPEALTAAAAQVASDLIARYWPGPLTLVLPRGPKISPLVTAGLPGVALRSPAHPVFQAVLAATARPLIAPSANLFGRTSPTTAQHVSRQLTGRIPLILDGGAAEVGLESTIVQVEPTGALTLLRPGGIAFEDLGSLATGLRVGAEAQPAKVLAPGMMAAHYAPRTPAVLLGDEPVEQVRALLKNRQFGGEVPQALGLLATGAASALPATLAAKFPRQLWRVEMLGPSAEQAASGLFAAMHRLDEASPALILLEAPPRTDGLWRGVFDRLQRAARAFAGPAEAADALVPASDSLSSGVEFMISEPLT